MCLGSVIDKSFLLTIKVEKMESHSITQSLFRFVVFASFIIAFLQVGKVESAHEGIFVHTVEYLEDGW